MSDNVELINAVSVVNAKLDGVITLMNAQFKGVNDRMDKSDIILQQTHDQAIRTNGRVSSLEDFKNKVADPVLQNRRVGCPNTKLIEDTAAEVKAINISLEMYKFFVKRPKLFVSIIVVSVVITLVSVFITANTLVESLKISKEEKIEQVKTSK